MSHKGLCEVLEALEKVEGVRRIFIRSGLRFDYLMADKDGRFFDRLVKKHVSGQLKVAPEHVSGEVLRLMNKPCYAVYERFAHRFEAATKKAGKPQYLLPYYISSHPGSTISDAIELALALKKQGFVPEQVQDFYPTPGTVSTCMFHTGLDPMTGKPVYVAKTPREKAMQRRCCSLTSAQLALMREGAKRGRAGGLIGPGGLVPGTAGRQPKGKAQAAGKNAPPWNKDQRGRERSRKKMQRALLLVDYIHGFVDDDGALTVGSPRRTYAKTSAEDRGWQGRRSSCWPMANGTRRIEKTVSAARAAARKTVVADALETAAPGAINKSVTGVLAQA